MGQRGEIFSTRIFTDEGRKTYFFNVKENRHQDIYLNIVESRKSDNGYRRSSIIVFQEDLDGFLIVFDRIVALIRRHESIRQSMVVGDGRRQYKFTLIGKGRPTLQISEERRDDEDSRYENIYIGLEILDQFMEEMSRAVSYLSKPADDILGSPPVA